MTEWHGQRPKKVVRANGPNTRPLSFVFIANRESRILIVR